jgi:hypothetical protein
MLSQNSCSHERSSYLQCTWNHGKSPFQYFGSLWRSLVQTNTCGNYCISICVAQTELNLCHWLGNAPNYNHWKQGHNLRQIWQLGVSPCDKTMASRIHSKPTSNGVKRQTEPNNVLGASVHGRSIVKEVVLSF